jgi:hypothetical protein
VVGTSDLSIRGKTIVPEKQQVGFPSQLTNATDAELEKPKNGLQRDLRRIGGVDT